MTELPAPTPGRLDRRSALKLAGFSTAGLLASPFLTACAGGLKI